MISLIKFPFGAKHWEKRPKEGFLNAILNENFMCKASVHTHL